MGSGWGLETLSSFVKMMNWGKLGTAQLGGWLKQS